jgi:hypothetical protein
VEKSEEAVEELKTAVNGGREFFERSGNLPLGYITDRVYLALREVWKYLIEERHKVDESENGKDNLVIHYTSIAVLVSMLQGASKDNEERKEKEDKALEPGSTLGDKKSLWRLYDSVHLNDPDEGNYLIRNLHLPEKYAWLGKKDDVAPAYSTSFIIPDSTRDMSDNLVFWRTYGREGEGCSLVLNVPPFRLHKVLYGTKGVQPTAGALRPILDLLDPLLAIEDLSIRESVQRTVGESLEKIRYLYKSEAYEYENECRFVVVESDIPRDKICYEYQERNNSPARIRHYCEHEALQLGKLLDSNSSITLGPCVPYRDNVRSCIEELRNRAELHGPEIKISQIAYRKS